MSRPMQDTLEQALGSHPVRLEPIAEGRSTVYKVLLADGRTVVAKTGKRLETEAYMLRYLAEHSALPSPIPLYATDTLLVMDYIEGSSTISPEAEQHAAELLTALHSISSAQFGLERDMLIGSLPQPNPLSDQWIPFFRDHRLMVMANRAAKSGKLPVTVQLRLERLAENLDRWLLEPAAPALLHGDIWSGNVLARDGKIVGLIDPAIYYGHVEIELAFISLFDTFGEDFYARYDEICPIEYGFFEERRDLYNLYPLLVHLRLFGGAYLGAIDRILRQFGY